MKYLNPNAIAFVAFGTLLGACFHHALIGATITTGIVALAGFIPKS
jgi:hypothetical protein